MSNETVMTEVFGPGKTTTGDRRKKKKLPKNPALKACMQANGRKRAKG
jgi:hypothetical protein